jgi:hypothetical protein
MQCGADMAFVGIQTTSANWPTVPNLVVIRCFYSRRMSQMKPRPATQFVATTLVCLMAMSIIACNKPQENTGSAPLGSTGLEAVDRGVTTRVKAALKGDENLKGFDIAVVTTKGDVRLTGVVDNQSQIDHVIKLARSIEGAQAIHDELTIKK